MKISLVLVFAYAVPRCTSGSFQDLAEIGVTLAEAKLYIPEPQP